MDPHQDLVGLCIESCQRFADLGYLDGDGYLYITGRIKEQYKLENGKYVMPTPLEQQLAASPYIAQVMLYGADRPFNVALVALDVAAVRAWAEREHVALGEDLASSEPVQALIADELARHSAGFRGFERPRAFVAVTDDFTIENGLLTPTLKLKRRELVDRYGAPLAALYTPAKEPASRPTMDGGGR